MTLSEPLVPGPEDGSADASIARRPRLRRGVRVALVVGTVACLAVVGAYMGLARPGTRAHAAARTWQRVRADSRVRSPREPSMSPSRPPSFPTATVLAAACDAAAYERADRDASAEYLKCLDRGQLSDAAVCGCAEAMVGVHRQYASCPGADEARAAMEERLHGICGRPPTATSLAVVASDAGCDVRAFVAATGVAQARFTRCMSSNSVAAACTCPDGLISAFAAFPQCPRAQESVRQLTAVRDRACALISRGVAAPAAFDAVEPQRSRYIPGADAPPAPRVLPFPSRLPVPGCDPEAYFNDVKDAFGDFSRCEVRALRGGSVCGCYDPLVAAYEPHLRCLGARAQQQALVDLRVRRCASS